MAIDVSELVNARSGDAFSRSIEYRAIGTGADADMTEQQAIAAVIAATPAIHQSLFRDNAQISMFQRTIDKTIAKVQMNWKELDGSGTFQKPANTGSAVYEFSYQAKDVEHYHALSTRRYPAGALNLGNNINVDEEGKVEGLPSSHETTNVFRLSVDKAYITSGYEATVESMMGGTNSVAWKGRPAHSVRFVSCQSQMTVGGQVNLSWGFSYRANKVDVNIAGINNVTIYGHELYWLRNKNKLDLAALEAIIETKGIYVHRVFDEFAFTALGIGA